MVDTEDLLCHWVVFITVRWDNGQRHGRLSLAIGYFPNEEAGDGFGLLGFPLSLVSFYHRTAVVCGNGGGLYR